MPKINLDEDFDFGFTTFSEEEFKKREEKAAEKAATDVVSTKVQVMYKMIIPLLQNLAKDSDKGEYIYWPNRKEKINAFIQKLDQIVKE